jgi:hypothetical protein
MVREIRGIVRVTDPIEPLAGLRRDAQKGSPVAISVAEKDAVPLVTACRRVIDRAGLSQPEESRHRFPRDRENLHTPQTKPTRCAM